MTGMMMGGASRSVSFALGPGLNGNRCRADSGSTYSSSDTSSRSKTSSRRRSHRPRGCRGGSSRKKRRGGKVPKEIIGATVENNNNTSSLGVSSSSNNNTKTVEVRESTTTTTKTLPPSLSGPESRSQKPTVSFADEENRQQITVSDENAGRTSTPQPFNANKYLPLTSNAAVYGENNKNDAVPMKSKTSASCLPPLQDSMKSFLAASKDQPPPQQQQPHPMHSLPCAMDLSVKPNLNGPSFASSQSQILPPLYHPEPAVHPSQEPNLQGPNIYALQNNHTYRDNNYGMVTNNHPSNNNSYPYTDYHGGSQQHPLYGYDNHNNSYGPYGANAMQQHQQINNGGYSNSNQFANDNYDTDFSRFHVENHPETLPVVGVNQHAHCSTTSSTSNNAMSQHHHNKARMSNSINNNNNSNKPPGTTSYRSERIEKQRQMMAEGGSLFVTSPKSFLMGWKSDDMPRM